MTTIPPATTSPSRPTVGRRVGYGIAIGVNVLLLVIVNNLLAWDLLGFLTADFELLLPIINLSLVATIAANTVYLLYDEAWFKSLTQIVLSLISLAVAYRTLQIFPFDFSEYSLNWAAITRIILVLSIVAITIGIIAEVIKLIRNLSSIDGVERS